MPNGVPVATVALNASKNAGILAVQMLAISNKILSEKLELYKKDLVEKVAIMSQKTQDNL
jgi:5-(carboxyamino)imidazole ribonucleotide mutase